LCHGTTNLYAALDVAPGQVIAETSPRHRADEFPRFLGLIDESVPAHLDVHVARDNSSTHKTPSIQRWLVRHPRFTLHFTPTYSSSPCKGSNLVGARLASTQGARRRTGLGHAGLGHRDGLGAARAPGSEQRGHDTERGDSGAHPQRADEAVDERSR
jgi:hypothetical protein